MLAVVGLILLLKTILRAELADSTPAEQRFAQIESELPPVDYDPLVPYSEPIGEPEWCESPYRTSAWRFEIYFTPTTFHLTDGAARYWTTDDAASVQRLGIGYENASGFGSRVRSWTLDEEFRVSAGAVESRVSTFYWDVYQRFLIEDAEVAVGGGLAVGNLRFASPFLTGTSRFTGGGVSIFGEGFYPFLRFKKTDVGVIGQARLAVLAPFEDDIGDGQGTIIDDLEWGLELRRRFGRQQDKSWYVSITREFQHWADASLPLTTDQNLQSTAIRFGVAW
jgi:hypothetical protein